MAAVLLRSTVFATGPAEAERGRRTRLASIKPIAAFNRTRIRTDISLPPIFLALDSNTLPSSMKRHGETGTKPFGYMVNSSQRIWSGPSPPPSRWGHWTDPDNLGIIIGIII